MFEPAEPLSRPFNIDMPERAPSAARLAAEAFFAPAPEASSEPDAPAVVVKKSKLEEPSPAASGETPEPGEQPREPRVFRLSAPVVAADHVAVEAPVLPGTDDPGAVMIEGAPSDQLRAAPRAVSRRRKRRELHGEVTITRPVAAVPAVATAPAASAMSDSEEIPASPVVPASPLQSVAPGNTAGAALTSHQWPRYLGMRRQLLALQAEAQAAKARESREVLVWIKQAITEYELTAADLGLVR